MMQVLKMESGPKIKDFMTSHPVTVPPEMTLAEAVEVMTEWGLRHLPVLEHHHLVGILSERDVARTMPKEGKQTFLVRDAMVRDPYCVDPDTSLKEVVQTMASNRLGCVVVRGTGERVFGIFTTTDALNVLAKTL